MVKDKYTAGGVDSAIMGRASMNEMARNIFSPNQSMDIRSSTNLPANKGLLAYAQPATGNYGSQVLRAKKSLNHSVQIQHEGGDQPLSTLSNNIMKLSSEALTYGQVKNVRGQIQRDCSLLRNRVRLL